MSLPAMQHFLPLAMTCSLVLLSACSERVSFLAPKFQMGSNNAQALMVTPDGEVHESGRLTISIRGFLDTLTKKRRLLATLADVEKVVLEVSASGLSFSQTLDKTAIASGTTTATFTGIPEGAATVTMKAYNPSNQLIGQASKATSVTAGATTTVEIQLQLAPSYTSPSTGGGSASTGSITANGTVIDGVTAYTYTLPAPASFLALDPSASAWVAHGDTVHQITPTGDMTSLTLPKVQWEYLSEPIAAFDIDDTGGWWMTRSDQMAPMGGHPVTYHYSGAPNFVRDFVSLWGQDGGEQAPVAGDRQGHGWTSVGYGRVDKWDSAGNILAFFETDDGRVWDLCTDSADNVWTIGHFYENWDMDSGQIPASGSELRIIEVVYQASPSGQILNRIPLVPSSEAWLKSWDDPTSQYNFNVATKHASIAVDSHDNVWVALAPRDRVMKLSSDGQILGSFAVGDNPQHLAVDPAGHVWVANAGDSTISKLAPDGHVLGTFAVSEPPYRIAAGSSGIWISHGQFDANSPLGLFVEPSALITRFVP